jgi:hypothetical protein
VTSDETANVTSPVVGVFKLVALIVDPSVSNPESLLITLAPASVNAPPNTLFPLTFRNTPPFEIPLPLRLSNCPRPSAFLPFCQCSWMQSPKAPL